MTLRKITVAKSVKYIPQNEQMEDSKPNTIKKKSFLPKQNKNSPQTKKKFIKNILAERFRIIK